METQLTSKLLRCSSRSRSIAAAAAAKESTRNARMKMFLTAAILATVTKNVGEKSGATDARKEIPRESEASRRGRRRGDSWTVSSLAGGENQCGQDNRPARPKQRHTAQRKNLKLPPPGRPSTVDRRSSSERGDQPIAKKSGGEKQSNRQHLKLYCTALNTYPSSWKGFPPLYRRLQTRE